MSIVGIALADDGQTSTRRLVNIPAQGLAPALQLLAKEWHLQIVYVSEEVGERRTQGSVGELDPQQALGQLLEGTGLTFQHLDDKTFAIVPAASAAGSGASEPHSRSSPAQTVHPATALTPAEPPQVTIEARGQALEDRVFHFVTALSADVSSHVSLARWHDKICPQVEGLPQAQSEFVLGRISTIARAVGAPLASGKCETNFLVLFTAADSAKQLKSLLLRRVSRLGAWSDHLTDVAGLNEFVADRRPIRAWYEVEIRDTWGNLLQPGSLPTSIPSLEKNPPLGSRIPVDYVQSLLSVLVVVDMRRIDGLGIGAVADCSAVLGLAAINPSADVAGTDSVLRLFTAPDNGKALSQLGTWDTAFLKALYNTAQTGRMQRQMIIRSMMGDDSIALKP